MLECWKNQYLISDNLSLYRDHKAQCTQHQNRDSSNYFLATDKQPNWDANIWDFKVVVVTVIR